MKWAIGLLCSISTLFVSFSFAAQVEEKAKGTVLEDGTVAGEKEALAHFQKYEPAVFKKLKEMNPAVMRKSHADKFYWYQRVGNYRKAQKCEGLHQLQIDFHLPVTQETKCISDILETHKE